MLNTAVEPSTEALTPFVVEHLKLHQSATGSATFTPAAQLLITSSLRTSGLLRTLPDREARTLLCLLTFLTPNGRIQLTLPEVAKGMGISEREADERLKQLAALRWQEEPVIHLLVRESGIAYATLSRRVLTEKRAAEQPAPTEAERLLPYRPAPRETIVDWSRTQYARPRDEVEPAVLEQLGHGRDKGDDKDNTPEGGARGRLLNLGVPAEQADLLLVRHRADEINEQIDWLPLREAKHPARFIVAAIQGKYDPPARIRLQRAIAAEEAREAAEAAVMNATAPRALSGATDTSADWDGTRLPLPEVPEEVTPGSGEEKDE